MSNVDGDRDVSANTDHQLENVNKIFTKKGKCSKNTNAKRGTNNPVKNVDKPNGNIVSGSLITNQHTCKYDLGLSAIANKTEKIRVAKSAEFNKKVFDQNVLGFGFLPLSELPKPIADNSSNQEMSIIEAHKKLIKDGRPNYLGLQIPVKSALNHEKFATYLQDYWDWQLPFFIKFGFPLDIKNTSKIISEKINHKSAIDFLDHVDFYISEEKKFDSLLGPYENPPFDLHTSPFLTRDKSSSSKRRVIVDLSWPIGNSVNFNVVNDRYRGVDFALTFPSIDPVTKAVGKFGKY